jgi:hypothetical protein
MNDADEPRQPALLPFLAVLRFQGPDAATFLQGQVTHDTRLLADGRTLLAAVNNPQGRVVALLRLKGSPQDVDALLPADLAEAVVARLKKFVLRARVDVRVAADLHAVAVHAGSPLLDAEANSAALAAFDYGAGRKVVVVPANDLGTVLEPSADRSAADVEALWWSQDVAAGLPQVFAASSEAFVPQMLNLDLLDAISFSKGCYTGQEIVARTQNLGRIKRRCARFRLPEGPSLPPLAALTLDGTKVAEVVMSARAGASVELLAVTSLEAWGRTLRAEDGREAVPQALPYPIAAA